MRTKLFSAATMTPTMLSPAIIPDAKHRAPEENPSAFTQVLKDFFVPSPRTVGVEAVNVA